MKIKDFEEIISAVQKIDKNTVVEAIATFSNGKRSICVPKDGWYSYTDATFEFYDGTANNNGLPISLWEHAIDALNSYISKEEDILYCEYFIGGFIKVIRTYGNPLLWDMETDLIVED